MTAIIHRIQDLTAGIAQRVAWLPPLVARLTIGIVFAMTGWGKLHNLEQVTGFFTDLGIPAPGFHAVFVSSLEFFGGICLILGLLTRYVSVPLMVTMVVAIITAKKDEIHGVADLLGQLEWLYLSLFLWLAVAGAGPLSLDRLLSKRSSSS